MAKSRIKKVYLQIVVFFVMAAGLYGCSRDGKVVSGPDGEAGGQQKNQAMGRYMESEVLLPDGAAYDSVISFQNGPEGNPVLFTRKEINGKADFTAYLLTEDLTWEEKDCGWLNQLGLTYEYGEIGIFWGEDHKLYAVYSEEVDQNQIARRRVVVTEDWVNGKEIQIPVLLETNELGYAYFPRHFTALKNGNLLFDSGHSIFLYDSAGQQRIAEIPSDDGYYFAYENRFYVIDQVSKSLISYDGADGAKKAEYPLVLDSYYGVTAAAGDNGDISLVSKEGIHILKNGSAVWELIIDGKRNTLGSSKYYPAGFATGSEEDYFVYYGSMDETSKLTRYLYQPDIPAEPETELTIFSLRDNSTVRQAVSEFQIGNPNVKIDFEPLMEDDSGAVADDYIKNLNTELLSGNGPDILILDGLSENSYIEKGVLEDITDEIEQLISTGDYLPNIAEGSRVDGRIYAVPVRIGIPMTFGRKEPLKEAGQLSSLAGLVQGGEVGEIFGTVDRKDFLSLYADAFLHNLVSIDGVIQEQELKDFLINMKLILDGSKVSDGTRENRPVSIWGLLEYGTSLYSQEVAGFFESGQGASIIEQARGELEADVISINQTYRPYGVIGINKFGKNKEVAVQFLRTALSDEIQRSDFYDGFTVNQNALEFLCGIERKSGDGYGGPINGIDGEIYEMKSGWPSEPLRRKLADFCKTAKYSAGKNRNIKQILMENTENYFDGTASLEETTEELMTKMTIYLQE